MPRKLPHKPVISTTGHSVSYVVDGKLIINDISFDFTENRIGIVGQNGSGKSTFARLLSGLISPTGGEIRVDGTNIAKDRKRAIQLVGILFQNADHQIIFPTVIEEISFGLRQLGQDKNLAQQNAQAILQKFNKSHWADVAISTLSEGQRHLVCLISVLAMNPAIIILDEPFSGLDIPTTMQLERYLSNSDAMIIHITHDPASLENYDRIIWLEKGAIRSDGTPDVILNTFLSHMHALGTSDDITDISH